MTRARRCREAASRTSTRPLDSSDAGQPQAGRGDVQSRRASRRPPPGGPAPARDGAGPERCGAKPKDNVVDAEFVDVDDKK